MPVIDIILSAYVGGSTGKSLFTHMRTAYRLDPKSLFYTKQPGVVLVIDASHGSALYETMGILFGRDVDHVDVETMGRTCYYYMKASNHNTFIAVRPKSKVVLYPQELLDIFKEVANYYPKIFQHLPQINYVICETNLPHDSIATGNTIEKLLRLWDEPQINLWSTWNTSSLLAQVEYNRINQLYRNISNLGIRWNHVHNPFSTTAGQPESEISSAMQKCFELDLGDAAAPFQLRDSCYFPAFSEALDLEATNEQIWHAAYQEYITRKERPANILPVYARSNYWGRVTLTRYHYSNGNAINIHRIQETKEFPDMMNKLSENMYSNIFFRYFEALQNREFE